MDLKYITRVLGGISMKRMLHCTELVCARTKKSRLGVILDMLACAKRYGAGYYDYLIFEFDKMTKAQRATYMTRFTNKKLMGMMNDPEYAVLFDEKHQFYQHFSEFLGRDFVSLSQCSRDELKAFLAGKTQIIAKPTEGECGKGIAKLQVSDFADMDALCDYLLAPEHSFGVAEGVIRQHGEMARLYPDSVNCLRIASIVQDGKAHALYAVLKTGNNGKFVDNLESGGFACHVDFETGVVCGPGHTSSSISDSILAESHPATGVAFRGFKVPYFREAVEMVEKAAMKIPQVRYIGWDVCITENGPAIIEGNNYAAYDFPQLPDDSQPREGLLKKIRDLGVEI